MSRSAWLPEIDGAVYHKRQPGIAILLAIKTLLMSSETSWRTSWM